MDDTSQRSVSEAAGDSAKRACDQCRVRKIRCDKETPCANCRIAKRQCSSSGLGQRPKEARQRVLISTQYERKIDQFEARLAGIERMLRELTISLTNRDSAGSANPPGVDRPGDGTLPARPSPSSLASDGVAGASNHEDTGRDNDADSAFEGDSSMAAHSVFASEFLHDAVTRTSFRALNPDMESALQSLQQIVAMQDRVSAHESKFENVRTLPKGGFRDLPMPPMNVVVALLREVRVTPPQSFTLTWICSVHNDYLSDKCRQVYFADEDYSLTTFAIANGGLYYLLQEKAWDAVGDRQNELTRYMELCRANFETALVNLPLLIPDRRESVEVLMLAATYAIEVSKFTLAWRFNTAAVTMCQTLGYHRRTSAAAAAADPAFDLKAALFWFAYSNDKCFSIRFGRSSMIQDNDITIPRRLGDTIHLPDPAWSTIFHQWITHAEFVGKAYEQLYSPTALTHTPERRAENARRLIRTLDGMSQNMRVEREAAGILTPPTPPSSESRPSPYSIALSIVSDDVMFYSARTLIYRAIPNERGSNGSLYAECIEAARKAFACHHDCMRPVANDLARAGYIHWTILYIPFVPVIVLFCHVIETSSAEDLQRLVDFTDSLQGPANTSKSIEKFYRICRVLCNVARLYTEAKAQQDDDMNLVGNDIDMYLSQLGFMPQHQDTTDPTDVGFGDAGLPDGDIDMNQSLRLGNWFSANRHIMGLLEEDLSEFEPKVWSSVAGPP